MCLANIGRVVLRKDSFTCSMCLANIGCVVLRKDCLTCSMRFANIGRVVLRKDCLTCSMRLANIGRVCAGVSTSRNAHRAMRSGSHHCSLQVLHVTHLGFRLHSWGLLLMIIAVISLVPCLADTVSMQCFTKS